MIERVLKVKGLDELRERCDWDFLAQPEMDLALDTFEKRILRGGKGLGARKNTLTPTTRPLALNVESTRIHPRVKGTTWGRKNHAIISAMAPAVMRKAVQRIEARWVITTRGGW